MNVHRRGSACSSTSQATERQQRSKWIKKIKVRVREEVGVATARTAAATERRQQVEREGRWRVARCGKKRYVGA